MSNESNLNDPLFQFTVDASPTGMVLLDEQNRIILVNPQALYWFGYVKSELLGRSLESLISPCQIDALTEYDTSELLNPVERSARKIVTAKRKNGDEFPVDVSFHPIETATGKLLLANISDASQRQKAEQIPNERLAAIGEMVSGLSHECRNALQRAHACVDLLELEHTSRDEQLDLATRIRRALNDLEQNYDIVRSYASPIYLELSAVNLSDLFQEAFSDLCSTPEYEQMHFKIAADPKDCFNRVDRSHMKQVLLNLVENSIAACQQAGVICIDVLLVEQDGKKWQRTAIADSGMGVPAHYRDRIFEPFFSTRQSGTGLGLAICRRIVEAHGGTITLKDTPATVGATFVIDLPIPKIRGNTEPDY